MRVLKKPLLVNQLHISKHVGMTVLYFLVNKSLTLAFVLIYFFQYDFVLSFQMITLITKSIYIIKLFILEIVPYQPEWVILWKIYGHLSFPCRNKLFQMIQC
jgi:hypothetical protein